MESGGTLAATQAVFLSIVFIDIERFSRPQWDGPIRARVRHDLEGLLDTALRSAGLFNAATKRNTGDGVLVLVDAPHRGDVLNAVAKLDYELGRHNEEVAGPLVRFRARVAVDSGDIVRRDGRETGEALNFASRMVDSKPLRDFLRSHLDEHLAVMVSDNVYRQVIEQGYCASYEAREFERQTIRVKETSASAWMLRHGRRRPSDDAGTKGRSPSASPQAVEPVGSTAGATAGSTTGATTGATAGAAGVTVVDGGRRHGTGVVRLWRASVTGTAMIGGRWSVDRRVLVATTIALCLVAAGVLRMVVPRFADCPIPVELPILTGQAMEAKLGTIADELLNRPDSGCPKANVYVFSAPTSDAAIVAVARGWSDTHLREIGPRPAVWIPDAGTDVARATRLGSSPRLENHGPIAVSPVVVAMTKVDREAVGLDRDASWAEILDAGGLRSRGSVRLMRASPTSSSTGLLATIAIYGTLGDGLRRDAEGIIEPIDAGEATALCVLGPANTAGTRFRAVVASEQSMVSRNREELGQCGATRPGEDPGLEAIYPADGTSKLDYPFVEVPSTAGDRDRQRSIARELLYQLRSAEGQRRLRQAGFRDTTDHSDSDERDGVLRDQPARALAPPKGDTANTTITGWDQARRPVSTLLVVDVSGSMRTTLGGQSKDRMTVARDGARLIAERTGDEDRLSLWKFSTEVDGRRDYKGLVPMRPAGQLVNGRTQRDTVMAQLGAIRVKENGDTGLYDTLVAGMAHLREVSPGKGVVRALIVVTDGENDDPSGVSLDKVIERYGSGGGDVYVAVLSFGTAACDGGEFTKLVGSGIQCIDAGRIGMERASMQISATLLGTGGPHD
jgi:hypothetical protein